MVKLLRVICVLCVFAVMLSVDSCGAYRIGETAQSGEESEQQTPQTAKKSEKTAKPAPVYTFPKPPEPTGELVDTLKVMTYNIQGGKPDGRTLTVRSSMHAAKINLVDPDVVLLCEARNFDRRDQDLKVSLLTSKCDVSYGIIEFSAEKSTNVILYNNEKLECVSSEVIRLDDGGDEYSRSAVIATLKLKQSGEEIVAVSTHLDLNMFAAQEQVWEILDCLEEKYSEYGTQIIAGDLNFESFEITMVGGPSVIHEDAIGKCGYYSANQRLDRTYTHKAKILDYIYFKGSYPSGYRVVTDTVGDYEPSDHYPVYAELGIYK